MKDCEKLVRLRFSKSGVTVERCFLLFVSKSNLSSIFESGENCKNNLQGIPLYSDARALQLVDGESNRHYSDQKCSWKGEMMIFTSKWFSKFWQQFPLFLKLGCMHLRLPTPENKEDIQFKVWWNPKCNHKILAALPFISELSKSQIKILAWISFISENQLKLW